MMTLIKGPCGCVITAVIPILSSIYTKRNRESRDMPLSTSNYAFNTIDPKETAFTSNTETVDLAYSTYDYCGKNSTKPPLIILHAILGSKSDWDSMSRAIHETTGRKVINVDARNHGDSGHSPDHTYIHQANDVINLLNKLELTKVSILGHCMGGGTAMFLSIIRPDLITSVVIDDVSPFTICPHKSLLIDLLDTMPTLTIRPGISMSEARELADEHLKTLVPDVNIRNYLLENLVQTNDGSYIWKNNLQALKNNFLTNILSFPNSSKGLQYSGPTLFMGASRSGYISKSDLPKIQEHFPSAELTFIEGGHWMHNQKPEEFLKVLSKFLIEN